MVSKAFIASGGALAVFAGAALAPMAQAAETSTAGYLNCKTSAAASQFELVQVPLSITVDVPDDVVTGEEFTATVTPSATNFPGSFKGTQLLSLQRMKFELALPAGVEYISGAATGGQNLAGTPTVRHDSGIVTLSGSGEILERTAEGKTSGGLNVNAASDKVDVTFPAIRMQLRATTAGEKNFELRANDAADYGVNNAVTYVSMAGQGALITLCATDSTLGGKIATVTATGDSIDGGDTPGGNDGANDAELCGYISEPSFGSAAKLLTPTPIGKALKKFGLGLGSVAGVPVPLGGSTEFLTTGSLGEGIDIPLAALGGSSGSSNQKFVINGQSVGDVVCYTVDGVDPADLLVDVPALGSLGGA